MSDLQMKGIYGVQLRIAQKDCAASIRKENMLLVESRTKSVQDRRIAMLKALRHNMQYGDCIRALRSRIGFGLAKAASMTIRAARSPEGSMGLPPAEED
ncbi:hypothetical protein GJ496_007508 [Pomphorhynchus laevis]|nr:hypothetical protein GJ496_007508 [Pomphorhynchus laevis]